MATAERTYPFELVHGRRPQLGIQPAMVLNHTIAIDGDEERRKESVTDAYLAVIGLPVSTTYRHRFKRWDAWTKRQANLSTPGFVRFEAAVKGRLIVGMGDESILENSITLTWVDGVPGIPGSAIKGLVGAVARNQSFKVTGGRPLEPKEREVISGTVGNASYFTFHDAWYLPDGDAHPLKLDVMTPHHQTYNASRGTRGAPADTEDPIPVNFLSTRGIFLFALQGPDANWTHLVRELLVFGLQHVGIGAKTSSGYGRFVPPPRTAPNLHETHELLVRIRAQSPGTYQEAAETIAWEIVYLDDGLREIAARAFAQWTRDAAMEEWLREQEWWEVVEDVLGPALEAR